MIPVRKFALWAGFTEGDCDNPKLFRIIKKFAELVQEDEREQMGSICKDAIAREREVCARFCDRAAKSIRAKNKK